MAFANDYIEVHERIEAFCKRYPDGSLQSEIVECTETRITMKAYAYRTPDDPRPGIGFSWLAIPGTTNFTRGSEIENAETSAWGRALAALGFETKKGIATKEEVENKKPQQPAPKADETRECPVHNVPMAYVARTKQWAHKDGESVCLGRAAA